MTKTQPVLMIFFVASLIVALLPAPGQADLPSCPDSPDEVVFAVIGDYGMGADDPPYESRVADMVASWNPAFILTVGDNNYLDWDDENALERYDEAVGEYYCTFIHPYRGNRSTNTLGEDCRSANAGNETRFYVTPGNHDWRDTDDPDGNDYNWSAYEAYFKPAPGGTPYNRTDYYTFQRGGINFFALNSNCLCEDPNRSTTGGCADKQKGENCDQNSFCRWLRDEIYNSPSGNWNVVYFHHPFVNTGHHGACKSMDFVWDKTKSAGVSPLILAGHVHQYQRTILQDDTNRNLQALLLNIGESGTDDARDCCTRSFDLPAGSNIVDHKNYCYRNHRGALKVTATPDCMELEYWYRTSRDNGDEIRRLLDVCVLKKGEKPSCQFTKNNCDHVHVCGPKRNSTKRLCD